MNGFWKNYKDMIGAYLGAVTVVFLIIPFALGIVLFWAMFVPWMFGVK